MARNRTPLAKARISGADVNQPGRYRSRSGPKGTRPLGDPYPKMTGPQKAIWRELARELSWLRAHHRVLLRMVCVLAARMDADPEFGISAHQALSSLLSKLGATPVDSSRVNAPDDADPDPTDEFLH